MIDLVSDLLNAIKSGAISINFSLVNFLLFVLVSLFDFFFFLSNKLMHRSRITTEIIVVRTIEIGIMRKQVQHTQMQQNASHYKAKMRQTDVERTKIRCHYLMSIIETSILEISKFQLWVDHCTFIGNGFTIAKKTTVSPNCSELKMIE